MATKITRDRWFIAAVAIAVLTACAPRAAARSADGGDVWIRNVHVIDPATGLEQRDRALRIRDGDIVAVVNDRDAQPERSVRVLDGAGSYAIPGLWDAHVHIMQNDSATTMLYAARLLAFGITHARDMGSVPAVRAATVPQLRDATVSAPSILSAGPAFWAFRLPYGDDRQKMIVEQADSIEHAVDRVADQGVDFIKVYAGFDRTRLPALIAAARRRGLRVAGHAQPGMTLAEQAALGVQTIEHLDFSSLGECANDAEAMFNQVIASRFRNSGASIPDIYAAFAAEVDTERCRAALRRAADAGLVLTPTLITAFLPSDVARDLSRLLPPSQQEECALYLRQFEGLAAAQQAVLRDAGRRLVRVVLDAGVPILAGTDAPAFCALPGESFAIELALLRDAGLSPLAVLQSATLTPARVFGPADRYGRLAAGYSADLVLLRDNPLTNPSAYREPLGVFTRSRWWDAASLQALRQ